ncbi:hypothetical protein KP509_35G034700 [Ceratopteris richardii]|uniref:RST domain-containing protein n=1 Tax=Ceratopteris richardii TaxID=49495 RepID=A0A8T2QH65_CERRI|nr:hypothetical protein KP509_35G034700 [Ceratopteris richardii]
MDRGVIQILEDDQDDTKPLIASAALIGTSSDHRSMDYGTTSVSSLSTFQPQFTGLNPQEKLTSSTNSSVQQTTNHMQSIMLQQQHGGTQQPANHLQVMMSQQQGLSQQSITHIQPLMSQQQPQQQQPGSQQGDKGQNPSLVERPGGTAQAISFGTLMPMLLPILPPDKAQNLNALYMRLKKSEISKQDFLRATRTLVGDALLVSTVKNMQMKGQSQRQQPAQTDMQHQLPLPQPSQQQPQQPPQPPPQQQQQIKAPTEQLQPQQQGMLQAHEAGHQLQPHQSVQQMQSSLEAPTLYQSSTRMLSITRQEQWSSSLSLQQVKHEVEKAKVGEPSVHGNVGSSNLTSQPGNTLQGSTATNTIPTPLSIPDNAIMGASGGQVRTPSKKVINEQKRPADLSPAAQMKSKKQKVSGDMLEQSIDQLNDVTAVSGVNLREEEEQLLAGPKEESRSNQAMRRLVQEEEGRLFLDKGPLRAKVNAIAARYGVSTVSEEAEQCLSMSVEERLRNMLYKLTKIAGRRCDEEKEIQKVVVTSDIQKQILLMRRRAKEAHERRQAIESERLRKMTEEKEKASQNDGASKEDSTTTRTKEKKKGDEGKQKASAASMAAKSANDMLLKWQMMAEQGRQKREGESVSTDTTVIAGGGLASSSTKDLDKKISETRQLGRAAPLDGASATGQSAFKKAPGDVGVVRRSAHHGVINQPAKPTHTITVKDIITYLETEPQMAKSSLIYRLHNKNLSHSQVSQPT